VEAWVEETDEVETTVLVVVGEATMDQAVGPAEVDRVEGKVVDSILGVAKVDLAVDVVVLVLEVAVVAVHLGDGVVEATSQSSNSLIQYFR
jgi:hypothetical protein